MQLVLVIYYWIGDVLQGTKGVSASEMLHIVSGGALNSTHSLVWTLVRSGYVLFVMAILSERHYQLASRCVVEFNTNACFVKKILAFSLCRMCIRAVA